MQTFKYRTVKESDGDNMTYSKVQERAVKSIDVITSHFGNERWFTQCEVAGIGYHTMEALVNKKFLRSQYFNDISYYQKINEV